jgi:hypothetical protein
VTLVSGVAHPSQSKGPLSVGSYAFRAHYNGDDPSGIYAAADSPCEPFSVTKAKPKLTTTATNGTAGGTIQDTAHFTGLFAPSVGTVTFTLYGPSSTPNCTAPIFTSTKPVTANGDVTSAPATVTAPGNYYWIASFSGDANNEAVITSCGDTGETSVVTAQTTGKVTGGGQIHYPCGSLTCFANFGYVAQNKPSGPQGSLEFNDRTRRINVHSTSITFVTVTSPTTATFGGNCSYTAPTFSGSRTCTFKVDLEDNGEPGSPPKGSDKFGIVVTDTGPGTPLGVVESVPLTTLDSGNNQIHKQ